jgi:hypothetical protein
MTASKSFKETQLQFIRHIKNPTVNPAPSGIEDRRMGIYRDLFFNNIKGFLSNGFPVLEGMYSTSDWEALARKFFSQHKAKSPYFVDISKEFVEYLSNDYELVEIDPPFMLELAHYEWLELSISVQKESKIQRYWKQGQGADKVILSELATVVSYQFPVHLIGPDYKPIESSKEPIYLVVYRNTSSEVNFSLLNAATAHMLSIISEQHLSLEQITEEMHMAMPHIDKDIVLKGAKTTIDTLLEQQILCVVS